MKQKQTIFYKILGITKKVSDDEIRKAYHKLAIKYHPDKNLNTDEEPNKNELATAKFREIQVAFENIKVFRDKEKEEALKSTSKTKPKSSTNKKSSPHKGNNKSTRPSKKGPSEKERSERAKREAEERVFHEKAEKKAREKEMEKEREERLREKLAKIIAERRVAQEKKAAEEKIRIERIKRIERERRQKEEMVAKQKAEERRLAKKLVETSFTKTNIQISYTPLMWLAENGHTMSASLLLELKPKINVKTNTGMTALMFAAKNNHTSMVALLLGHGAIINSAEKTNGMTALLFAAQLGNTPVIKMILEKTTNINTLSWREDGQNAVMLASMFGHLESIKLLVSKGVSIGYALPDGTNAFMLATGLGKHEKVIKFFITDSKIDINATRKDGNTALSLAKDKDFIIRVVANNLKDNGVAWNKMQLELARPEIVNELNIETLIFLSATLASEEVINNIEKTLVKNSSALDLAGNKAKIDEFRILKNKLTKALTDSKINAARSNIIANIVISGSSADGESLKLLTPNEKDIVAQVVNSEASPARSPRSPRSHRSSEGNTPQRTA